jgi:hypothetical protein
MKPSEGLKRSRGQYKGLYEKEKEARRKDFENVVRIDRQDKNGKVTARFPRLKKST